MNNIEIWMIMCVKAELLKRGAIPLDAFNIEENNPYSDEEWWIKYAK